MKEEIKSVKAQYSAFMKKRTSKKIIIFYKMR